MLFVHDILGFTPSGCCNTVKAIVFPRLFYGVSAWGGISRFEKHLKYLDRVLRKADLVTPGLLHTTNTVKATAACGWLPVDLVIRYELVWFVLCQWLYVCEGILERDHVLGVN